MGQTHKRNDDRYTSAFKLRAVKLANHPNVKTKDHVEDRLHAYKEGGVCKWEESLRAENKP